MQEIINNMQTKTATIEFIKQDNNTEVQVTQNGLTFCTRYPSELANKVQYLVENIKGDNVTVTQLTTNKIEVSYTLQPKQEILNLAQVRFINERIYDVTVYVDNRPVDQDKAELKIVVIVK